MEKPQAVTTAGFILRAAAQRDFCGGPRAIRNGGPGARVAKRSAFSLLRERVALEIVCWQSARCLARLGAPAGPARAKRRLQFCTVSEHVRQNCRTPNQTLRTARGGNRHERRALSGGCRRESRYGGCCQSVALNRFRRDAG
jgi:hypothetical protein